MTTSVLNFTGTPAQRGKVAKAARRPPLSPFGRLLSLLETSLSMTQAIPDNGRISPSRLAKVRAMAESI